MMLSLKAQAEIFYDDFCRDQKERMQTGHFYELFQVEIEKRYSHAERFEIYKSERERYIEWTKGSQMISEHDKEALIKDAVENRNETVNFWAKDKMIKKLWKQFIEEKINIKKFLEDVHI